jgi:uncharacterized repeat protein (TIGR01451 family)
MSRRISGLAAALAVAGLTVQGTAFAVDAPGFTELISSSSAGALGNQTSELPSISADGRYVAFASLADNLVPGDTNVSSDIFVRDRQTGVTERVSVSSSGREGDNNSGLLEGLGGPSISADGRFVAFDSNATNLVKQDRNNAEDVFVRDRLTGTTTRVSVTSSGAEASGSTPAISADGRFVAFLSVSENLAPGDSNFASDVFVRDLQTGLTERISQAPDGADAQGASFFAPHLSADGRFVYFSSFASNLTDPGEADSNSDVDAFLFDRQNDQMTAVTSFAGDPASFVTEHGITGGMSSDGRFLTFSTEDPGFIDPNLSDDVDLDTNGFNDDAFRFDRSTGVYTLLSLNDAGVQGDEFTLAGPVSDNGRFATLVSRATNFGGPANFRENVYLRDVQARTTRLVSVATDGTQGELDSINPAMTPDASAVAFQSRSPEFLPDPQGAFGYNVFVRDIGRADLALTMTDAPDPVAVRGQLTYTLTVRNDGPSTATRTTLVDTLPAVTFVSATPAQGTCVRSAKAKTDGVLTCQLGSIASGQSTTVTVVVSPAKAGSLTNTATVSADQPDPDGADNSATETTTVLSR